MESLTRTEPKSNGQELLVIDDEGRFEDDRWGDEVADQIADQLRVEVMEDRGIPWPVIATRRITVLFGRRYGHPACIPAFGAGERHMPGLLGVPGFCLRFYISLKEVRADEEPLCRGLARIHYRATYEILPRD